MLILLVALTSVCGMRSAWAAELVMFERAGCTWCLRWDREVAPLYDKTDEARLLPLRRINLDRAKPNGLLLASPVIFTPTFVIIDDGQEVGRITGYANDDAFWGLLGNLLSRLRLSADPTRNH